MNTGNDILEGMGVTGPAVIRRYCGAQIENIYKFRLNPEVEPTLEQNYAAKIGFGDFWLCVNWDGSTERKEKHDWMPLEENP